VNGTIVASVAGNALTVAIKTLAGNDPSANDPVYIFFRNATAATGDYVKRTLTAATSIVISSGSTLGTANSTPFRLRLVAFDDGGTVRLGLVNTLSGTTIMPLRDDMLLSSTAEGGAGATDSPQVIYTGTAVTTKAQRMLGYLDWSSGLATAGAWSGGPSKIQLHGPGVALPGQIVQSVVATSSTHDNTGTTSTSDVSRGTSLSITPRSEINPIQLSVVGAAQSNGSTANSHSRLVLKRGGSTKVGHPIALGSFGTVAGVYYCAVSLQAWDLPYSTSAQTYQMYGKVGAGTTTLSFPIDLLTDGGVVETMTAQELMV
jgi:hypothetical protein